jgi:DNA-binding phage protein
VEKAKFEEVTQIAIRDRIVYVTDMTRAKAKAGFDKYVQTRMDDREFASAYREARAEIDAVDSLMRQLDDARKRARLSKADLARRASAPQESVRRLLTARRSNPTLQTVVRLARAVGLRIQFTRVHARSANAQT